MKDRSLGLVGGSWERAAQRSWDSAGALLGLGRNGVQQRVLPGGLRARAGETPKHKRWGDPQVLLGVTR